MEESEKNFLDIKNKYEEKNKKYEILEKFYNEYKVEKEKGKKNDIIKIKSSEEEIKATSIFKFEISKSFC